MYVRDMAESRIIGVARGDIKDVKFSQMRKMMQPKKMGGDAGERANRRKTQFQRLESLVLNKLSITSRFKVPSVIGRMGTRIVNSSRLGNIVCRIQRRAYEERWAS